MGDDRAALLGESGLIEGSGVEAVEGGGSGENGVDGDDSGAADAGGEHAPGGVKGRGGRGRGRVEGRRGAGGGAGGSAWFELDADETGAVAEGAGFVFVAGGLVDGHALAVGGFERDEAHAVRLAKAVATAFADAGVDDEARGWFGVYAPGTFAAFFGGALLVVDEDADAFHIFEFAEGVFEGGAVTEDGVGSERLIVVERGVFGEDDGALDAFGFELAREGGDGDGADGVLTAGHGDVAVVEDAVGDVDAGGDGSFDGEGAGVKEGAVAHVLEDVAAVGEGGHADPRGTFGAHLRREFVAAMDFAEEHSHAMAADASAGDLAVEEERAAVVRASGAVVGSADGCGKAFDGGGCVEGGEAAAGEGLELGRE